MTPNVDCTIREYYLAWYEPERLADKNRYYREQYRSALSLLEAHLENDPERLNVNRITERDLNEMKAHALESDYAPITVTKYRWLLRSILRHARPADFPPLVGKWSRAVNDEYHPVDEPGTVWHFYLHVYAPYRLLGKSDGSRIQMETAIRMLCRFVQNPKLGILDLSDDLLMEFAEALCREKRSNATVNSKLEIFRRLWRFSVKRKLRIDHPDNERLPKIKRLPTAWTMKEFGTLLDTCEKLPGKIKSIPANLFWTALLTLMYDTGLRLSAAIGLPWNAVHWETGFIMVPAELMKNRCEQRFLLHADTLALLAKMIEPKRELLFAWPHGYRETHKRYRKILQKALLPDGRRDLFHKVRRTSATHLAAQVGIPEASRHLGHKSIDTTMRYIDERMLPTVKAAVVLPRPIRGGKDGAL